jgi:invasion protein IalB
MGIEVGSAGPIVRRAVLAALLTSLTAQMAAAQGALLIEKYGDWSFFKASAEAQPICFIASAPKESDPAGAKRDAVLFYVSAWPKEGVKSEVSIKLGYPAKKASEGTVTVGKDTFKVFTKDERAFVADPTLELKLIEAMKKAPKLVVQATSERGTTTSDTYSLNGLTQALQAVTQACP